MPEGTIQRKPRKSGFAKMWKKFNNQLVQGLPYARYALVSGALLFAIYRTEPQPTLLELLNPFV